MHIPPHKLLPQDMVDVFDHGPPHEPHPEPIKVRMHATDAKHAMQVEPARWALDKIVPAEPEPEPEIEIIEDDVATLRQDDYEEGEY